MFLWFFLAVQVVFIIWLIVGGTSTHPAAGTHAQDVTYCANGGWQSLYHSQAQCVTQYGVTYGVYGLVGRCWVRCWGG